MRDGLQKISVMRDRYTPFATLIKHQGSKVRRENEVKKLVFTSKRRILDLYDYFKVNSNKRQQFLILIITLLYRIICLRNNVTIHTFKKTEKTCIKIQTRK